MARSLKTLAAELSVEELKRLLAVKEKLSSLEKRKAHLAQELAKIDAQIAKLVKGDGRTRRTARKTGRKPAVRKKTRAAKAAKAGIARKMAVKSKTKRKAPARQAAAGKPTVETVVVDLIRKNGAPMKFQGILGAITKRKLVKTRSKNFANVLRRTLSTSKKLKRVGRGVYALA